MSTDCRDLEVLVSLRASGGPDALDAAEAARLDAHLAGCAACRAELDASARALSLARLPPLFETERRAMRDFPARVLGKLHEKDRRRSRVRRALVVAAGIAVAAGLGVVVVAPALFEKKPGVPVQFAESQQEESWQVPDMDTLWSDADVVDLDASASSDGEGSDAAVAALEY